MELNAQIVSYRKKTEPLTANGFTIEPGFRPSIGRR